MSLFALIIMGIPVFKIYFIFLRDYILELQYKVLSSQTSIKYMLYKIETDFC